MRLYVYIREKQKKFFFYIKLYNYEAEIFLNVFSY